MVRLWMFSYCLSLLGGAISNNTSLNKFLFFYFQRILGGAISNLYGMLTARHKRFPSVKYTGMSSKGDIVIFTSEQVKIGYQRYK